MGDQIFTDVLCARLCGAQAFLVPPIKDRTDLGTRAKRFFERGFLRRFYKKHPDAPDIRKGSPLTEYALQMIAAQTEKIEKGENLLDEECVRPLKLLNYYINYKTDETLSPLKTLLEL